MNDVSYIPIDQLCPFAGHPYKVMDNDEMYALADSIRAQGVLSPVVVRPLTDGKFEIISGHRRVRASELAGRKTVPAFIREMDRDEAAIALVDSNLHRDHLLLSEKAFAYRMKLEAIRHQGKHLDIADRPSADLVSAVDSGRQVQRIIRLTFLIPELLKMVDESVMAFTPATNISYLMEEEQYWLLDAMLQNDCTPSVSQSIRLKEKSIDETLTKEYISELMSREKANQRESIRIPLERLNGIIPREYTPKQAEDFIVRACNFYAHHVHEKRKDEGL